MAEEEQAAGGTSTDPAGISLALAGASRSEADAYLRDQRHHLHEDLKQIGLKLWELRMGVALRVATLIIGLAAATGLGALVWDAAHSKGMIFEPFNVPPDLAARGLNGEVIASQMIDKLTAMTRRESARSAQSYANNWGSNIKVEIPETGVSIGELRNFLRDWLGHDIRISGEVYKTADGIAVTARTGGTDEGATYTGKESDLDALIQKAAEHVYEVTQPYRYANYLDRNFDPHGADQREAKARAIYFNLIAGDDPKERAWAWNGLGTLATNFEGDWEKSVYYYRKALQEDPSSLIATFALSARPTRVISDEERYQLSLAASRGLHANRDPDLNPHYVPYATLTSDFMIAFSKGDNRLAVGIARSAIRLPSDFATLGRPNFIQNAIWAMARGHDMPGVRAFLQELNWRELPVGLRSDYDIERQDWRDMLVVEDAYRRRISAVRGGPLRGSTLGATSQYNHMRPIFALAHAELGDFAGAEKLIAPVPAYMDAGLQDRAKIAELQGQHARADWWFARAKANAPSLPFADSMWGTALLARGQPDAAIEKFTAANRLGPKFADPLEGWGEALMAKNQSHLALEKFAEADKYAPNWGRLHLKWGEALYYAGKRDEAKAQFARAAALDLTSSEKSELARAPHV